MVLRSLLAMLCLLLLNPLLAQERRGPGNMVRDGFPPRAPRETELAPDVELMDARGERIRLSSLRGKWVVLDFNENGHAICDSKRESMQQIRRKFAGNDQVQFLTILSPEKAGENGRIGRPEDRPSREMMTATHDSYAEALKDHEALYPGTRLVTDGTTMQARLEYGTFVNMTYLIDPEGRVAKRWPWNDPMQLESELDVRTGQSGAAKVSVFGGKIAPDNLEPGTNAGTPRERGRAAAGARDLLRLGVTRFMKDRDKDGDGMLTAEEAGLRGQQFQRADLDKDGKLSAEELTVIRNFIEENMPRPAEL